MRCPGSRLLAVPAGNVAVYDERSYGSLSASNRKRAVSLICDQVQAR